MKKIYYLALVALVGIAFSSCSLMGGDKDPSWRLSDLQGLWLENNTEHFVRFTTEQSDETGYLLGREWNEDEDKHEEDLINQCNKDGFPGNGWFKYEFKSDGSLTEIHFTKTGGVEIPKVYVVTKLTDTTLEYYDKKVSSSKFKFTKKVEVK